jgi:hypothetical protein
MRCPPYSTLWDTGVVAAYCTCGVELPPDARFCHKCGKPQYDEPLFETVEPPPLPQPAVSAPAQPLRVDFHNSMAVRVSALSAFLINFLSVFPMPTALVVVWRLVLLLGGGFFAAYLYTRRTGNPLSIRGGAQMGWITGIFCFVISTVLFTIGVVGIAAEKGLSQVFTEMANQTGSPELAAQFQQIFASPASIATVVLIILVALFIFLTAIPAVGGALGAKVLEKE